MLELNPIKLNDKYCKKWNIYQSDFLHLCKDGVKINDTLYRIGGCGINLKDDYFMLLKHVEAYYEDNITKIKKNKPHLESQWCIIDKNGVEKINFESFEHPYLKGGIIYTINNNFYNIETGELYCLSYSTINTKQFIFLNNAYDKDESKRGVMKVNKIDGTWELFQ